MFITTKSRSIPRGNLDVPPGSSLDQGSPILSSEFTATAAMDPLGDRGKLIPGFHYFLPGGHRTSFPRYHSRRRETDSQRRSHRTDSLERVFAFVNKLRDRFRRKDHLYVSFLETICAHPEEGDAVLKKAARLLRHHPDLLREFRRIAAARTPTAQATAKREAAAAMWRWEDERHEMDLIGRYLITAAQQANQLSAAITLGTYVNKKNGIEHYFSAHNLVMIQQMYGRHGEEFMAALRRDPGPAIPLILRRLEQKRVEWKKCSARFRRIDQF